MPYSEAVRPTRLIYCQPGSSQSTPCSSQCDFSTVCDQHGCKRLGCLRCGRVVADAIAGTELARETTGLLEGTHGHSEELEDKQNGLTGAKLHLFVGCESLG